MISILYCKEEHGLADAIFRYLEINGDIIVDTSYSFDEAVNKMKYIAFDAIVMEREGMLKSDLDFLKNVRGKGYHKPIIFSIVSRHKIFEREAKIYKPVSFIVRTDNFQSYLSDLYCTIKAAAPSDYKVDNIPVT